MIGPVQSHYHEGNPMDNRSLLINKVGRIVEKRGFEPVVKE